MAFIYMIQNQKTTEIFFKKSISIIKSIFAEEFFFFKSTKIENSFLRLKNKSNRIFKT